MEERMISSKMIGYGVHLLSDLVNKIVRICLFITASSFALLIFCGVVFRYVIKHPLMFSVEISKLLFIWSAFLGVTVAYKEKKHIRFQFLNLTLNKRLLHWNEWFIRLCGLLFFSITLFHAIRFTRVVWPTFFPVLNLSQGWLYVGLVVALCILIVHSIDLLLEAINSLKEDDLETKKEKV